MTIKKPKLPLNAEIVPHFTYRKFSPVALNVIGLGPSQLDEAIERGELPPPLDLTPSGRAQGWTGQQLLDLQAERLARAQEKVERRRAAVRAAAPLEEDRHQGRRHRRVREATDAS
jgi:hypothetical protein